MSKVSININSSSAPAYNLVRIKRDVTGIVNSPPPGIYGVLDDQNVHKVYALVIGPSGTPYEGGMFRFLVNFSNEYPMVPPIVQCLTAVENNFYVSPNIHASGRICLSLLGTFVGPSWSPIITLSGLILCIQSLMTDKPYHNEPGFEKERTAGASEDYSILIRHEVIRVAVCEAYEKRATCNAYFRQKIEETFKENYDHYIKVCNENKIHDRKNLNDPFANKCVKINFQNLLEKLQTLK